jgi:hypothetical protein
MLFLLQAAEAKVAAAEVRAADEARAKAATEAAASLRVRAGPGAGGADGIPKSTEIEKFNEILGGDASDTQLDGTAVHAECLGRYRPRFLFASAAGCGGTVDPSTGRRRRRPGSLVHRETEGRRLLG